jgi:hypothetical protein
MGRSPQTIKRIAILMVNYDQGEKAGYLDSQPRPREMSLATIGARAQQTV